MTMFRRLPRCTLRVVSRGRRAQMPIWDDRPYEDQVNFGKLVAIFVAVPQRVLVAGGAVSGCCAKGSRAALGPEACFLVTMLCVVYYCECNDFIANSLSLLLDPQAVALCAAKCENIVKWNAATGAKRSTFRRSYGHGKVYMWVRLRTILWWWPNYDA